MKTFMVRVALDESVPSHVTAADIVLLLQAQRGVSGVHRMVFRPDTQGGMWVPAEEARAEVRNS